MIAGGHLHLSTRKPRAGDPRAVPMGMGDIARFAQNVQRGDGKKEQQQTEVGFSGGVKSVLSGLGALLFSGLGWSALISIAGDWWSDSAHRYQ
jgi:hypothetical protein